MKAAEQTRLHDEAIEMQKYSRHHTSGPVVQLPYPEPIHPDQHFDTEAILAGSFHGHQSEQVYVNSFEPPAWTHEARRYVSLPPPPSTAPMEPFYQTGFPSENELQDSRYDIPHVSQSQRTAFPTIPTGMIDGETDFEKDFDEAFF